MLNDKKNNLNIGSFAYKSKIGISRLYAFFLFAFIFITVIVGLPQGFTGGLPDAAAETREEIRTLYKAGVDYIKDSNFEAAEAVFKKIIEAGYEFAEAYNNLGYARMKLKKDADAVFEFKNALRLNPDFADALNNLGLLYSQNPATALMGLQYLKRAVELDTNNANYHDSLGLGYHRLGFIKEAEVEFKTSNLIDRTLISPVYNLGYLYESNDRQKPAIAEYLKVISMRRDHLMANYRLFKIYSKIDDRPLMANYLYSIFKILKTGSKVDKNERELVEQEIICNLKALIVEVAVNFNADIKKMTLIDRSQPGGGKDSYIAPSEYLISYDEFSKKDLFYFFEGTELRCPQTGKYYTNYINHVVCPVHGSLSVFTDKLNNIKQVRLNYHKNICAASRKMLDYAVFLHDIDRGGDKITEIGGDAIKSLIENGYLRDIPQCPDGGSFSVDENGFVKCSIHGVSN